MLRVPLVDGDLSHEETVFRILESLRTFSQKSSELFSRVEARTRQLDERCDGLQTRANFVEKKLEGLKTTNTAIVLEAPALFPDEEYMPFRSFYAGSKGVEMEKNELGRSFAPSSKELKSMDIKRELEARKHMYVASQVLSQKRREKEKTHHLPNCPLTVADLFVAGTTRPGYSQVGGAFEKKKSRTKISDRSSRLDQIPTNPDEYPLGETAIAIGRGTGTSTDPLAYQPQVAASMTEELQLPDVLPHLPGIASDVIFSDIVITAAMLPDIEEDDVAQELPVATVSKSVVSSTVAVQSPAEVIVKKEEQNITISVEQKKEVEVKEPQAISNISSTQQSAIPPSPALPAAISTSNVPPPPAPPPPPPMALLSPAKTVVTPEGADSSNRSDLMAAIRAAGGAGKAKLKSVNATTGNKKTDLSLESSSALPSKSGENASGGLSPGSSKPIANGGDLMSSLAKALEARRKAIAGRGGGDSPSKRGSDPSDTRRSAPITGPMSRISELIPPPPAEVDKANEEADPEWDS